MPFATAHTISLQGAVGHLIDVQVDVSQGIVTTSLVGRADASINEARDRCRTAVGNCHLTWPNTRRVTILLSPTDLPKRGPHFDLAIACGVLAASDQVPREELGDTVLIGELTLDGRVRTVPGVLPMVLAAAGRGIKRVVVPEPQAHEARLVPEMAVVGVRSLGQVVAVLRNEPVPEAPAVEPGSGARLLSWRGSDRLADVDMADLMGMADARFAVEVAAAGGHHLLLTGPKGAGKTSLAERIPGILPDLSLEESLELTAVHSLAGVLDEGAGLITRPPFIAPHHTTSRAALLGGGTGLARPGEVSRTHCGVLFLDEFPLLNTDIIEALRQPLESGEITIARGDETATYPARTMFVLACNPCPCGDYTPSVAESRCTCREVDRREYRRKLSGPAIDRIDITRHVEPLKEGDADPLARPESSAAVRERVARARAVQARRYAGQGWRVNAHVPAAKLATRWPLTEPAAAKLATEIFSGRLTRRGGTRVHRLAWTVADLAGVPRPGEAELEAALALRTGAPLLLDALGGRSA
jgi:magnesium chelatase family protein